MLRLRYAPLVSVQVMHSFYADGRSPDFVLTPTLATRALLDTYNWVARQDNRQFTLMGREDEPALPTIPLDEPVVLTFWVRLTNPLLPNVSDWGTTGPFYFTNLNPANGQPKPADATGNVPLTATALVTAADQLPPVRKQQLSFSLDKGVYKSLTLSRTVPGAGLKPVRKESIAANLETLAITQPVPGRYTLTWEKADGSAPVVEEVYLSDETAAGPGLFGVVELFLSQTPAAPINYVIAMQHRQRAWRYVLVDVKSKLGPSDDGGAPNLAVTYQAPGAPFPDAVDFAPVTEPDAADAELLETIRANDAVKAVYLFQSADALPVLEKLAPKMRLTYTGGSSALPVPTPETQNATLFFTI